MASVSFFIRGKVEDRACNIYVKFKVNNIEERVPIPYLKCIPKDWGKGRCKSSKKKMHNDEETINVRLSKLQAEILTKYEIDQPEMNIKEWLKYIINPDSVQEKEVYSENVIEFFDTYMEIKAKTVSISTLKKVNVVKNLLIRYEAYCRDCAKTFKYLKFKDLDNKFRMNFEKYCENEHYQLSTTYRNLKFLKMIAKVAKSFGIEVNSGVENWVFEIDKATKDNPDEIYLTFEELEKIEQAEMPNDYLDNARDWLLIACYTGQRISDYLNFTSSMIITDEDGISYIEFSQKKTNTKMRLPILSKVSEILDKRNGEFPRRISEQKLNKYIKKVGEIAGIDEMVYRGKVGEIDGKKRKIFGKYPKYELITSHIGRRSFASNFYGKISTTHILNFTGHTTEKQLLTYIGKSETEKSRLSAIEFKKLGY